MSPLTKQLYNNYSSAALATLKDGQMTNSDVLERQVQKSWNVLVTSLCYIQRIPIVRVALKSWKSSAYTIEGQCVYIYIHKCARRRKANIGTKDRQRRHKGTTISTKESNFVWRVLQTPWLRIACLRYRFFCLCYRFLCLRYRFLCFQTLRGEAR